MAALCATRSVFRDALVRPGLEGAEHGLLHRFFGEVEIRRAEQAGQVRNHQARLPPEQVLQQNPGISRGAHDPHTWRTSMVPPYSACGWPSASWTA
jgi:hypothetical protein